MINTIKHAIQEGASKCIKAILIVGTTLFITLNVGANPTSAATKKELKDICKQNPDKEIVVKVEDQQSDKIAKFESTKDSIKDPYDQIKSYVNVEDTAYFMQLKKHMETKDSSEQIKCKAVVYAILQDTTLTAEQKKILSLSQFEILARMPGSDYKFSKKSGGRLKTHPDDSIYKDRVQWYLAYKTYLTGLDLNERLKQSENKLEQSENKLEQSENKLKQSERELNLLKKLLNEYKTNK
ncbi:MAG: hypothetical protein NT085_02215 [candidate division SR1 bacterium]|nr:hypothetical protein [candidate division SR1 bacterium]